jgi:hypothetical protein
VKKFAKYSFSVIIVCIALYIAAALSMRTDAFRNYLRSTIAEEARAYFNGNVFIGNVRGNLFSGFETDSIAIEIDNAPFVETRRAKFSFDLFSALKGKYYLNSAELLEPHIHIHSSSNGTWNLEKFLSSDTSHASPTTFISISRLGITNGEVFIVDSTKLSAPFTDTSHTFSFQNLHLTYVNALLSLLIDKTTYEATIKNFFCESDSPKFSVRNFSGKFLASPSRLRADGVEIQTERSKLSLSASLEGVNIFAPVAFDTLQHKPIAFSLYSPALNGEELSLFLPKTLNIQGTSSLDIRASGEIGTIALHTFHAESFDSYIQLTGTIHNIHIAESLLVETNISESAISLSEISSAFPSFSLPQFSQRDAIQCSGNINATRHQFDANVELKTFAGNARIAAKMDWRSSLLKYEGKFFSQQVNLKKFFEETNASFPETRLNVSGIFSGEGTQLDSLVAECKLTMDSSSVQLTSEREQTIDIRRLHLDFSARKHILKTSVSFEIENTNGTIHTSATLNNNRFTHLESEGTIAHLNPATYMNNSQFTGDISFHFSGNVTGETFNNLSATLEAHFHPSTFAGRSFGNENETDTNATVTLIINQQQSDKKYSRLHSPFLDAQVEGAFDILTTPNIVFTQLKSLLNEVALSSQQQITKIDTEGTQQTPEHIFSYNLSAKNLEPLSIFSGSTAINFRGTITGNFQRTNGNANLNGKIIFDSIAFTEKNNDEQQTIATAIRASNGNISYDIHSEKKESGFAATKIQFVSAMDHAYYNGTHLDSIRLFLETEQQKGNFFASTIVNNAYAFHTRGTLAIEKERYNFSCSPFLFSKETYRWNNEDTLRVSIYPKFVRFENCVLQRDSQRVQFSGDIVADSMKLLMNIKNFSFNEVSLVGNSSEHSSSAKNIFSGSVNGSFTLRGTFLSPEIEFNATSDNIAMENVTKGTVSLLGAYAEKNLAMQCYFSSNDSLRPFTCSLEGELPLDLSFAHIPQRFPDNKMNLHVVGNAIPLALFDPFIPRFDNVTGTLTCSLAIGGTTSLPDYRGAIKILNGKFQYEDNKLWYNVSGMLRGEGKRMRLANVVLSNERTERSDGNVFLDGYFTLRGITIDSINARAKGQLLVLKSSIRNTKQGAYGNLFLATDTSGITYRGTFEHSVLQGTMFVQDADMTFPAIRETEENSATFLPIIIIDDTSKIFPTLLNTTEPSFLQTKKNERNEVLQKSLGAVIVEGMAIDVTVETQGTNQLRMIFSNNPATSEELYAELQGKLSYRKTREGVYLLGDLNIGENSYYNFFKRFAATGSMKFTGNLQNPELNILAAHEGIHTVFDSLQNQQRDYKILVQLHIAGTRAEPKISIAMKQVEGQDTTDFSQEGKDAQSDALAFILTGKFRDELTSGERSQLVLDVGSSVGSSVVTGFTTSVLSGMLTEFLRDEFGFIRSAEISYRGGNVSEAADVRLSGELFNAYWRFGGRILNDIGRANVSFQIPLGEVVKSRALQNIFIEVERKVEDETFASERKLTNTARLFYKFSY